MVRAPVIFPPLSVSSSAPSRTYPFTVIIGSAMNFWTASSPVFTVPMMSVSVLSAASWSSPRISFMAGSTILSRLFRCSGFDRSPYSPDLKPVR